MKIKNFTIGFCAALILMLIFLVACEPPIVDKRDDLPTKYLEFQSTDELRKFSSVEELRNFLKNSAVSGGYIGASRVGLKAMAGGEIMATIAESSAVEAKAVDYSQTNVQVKGVDEADFVKNDDKYIYVISGSNLVIVDAYPAENAKILSETKLKGRPRNMFVNKDRLVIFTEDNDQVYIFSEFDYMPRPRYTPKTRALVYDITCTVQ